MRLGLAYLLLVCFIGIAVSEYRERDDTKDEKAIDPAVVIGSISAAIGAANLVARIRWGRWGRWGWGKRGFSQRETAQERLAEAFNTLDVDGDAFVDMDELKDDFQTVLKGYTRGPVALMADTDKNKDGKIDFEEFFAELGPSNGQMRRV